MDEVLLAKRYRLGKKIGVGGMGVVHAATDEVTGRPVAVKILRLAVQGDASAITRFEREARATLTIDHPNVVQVSDVGIDPGGMPFYVMERLHGRSLGAVVRQEGRMKPKRVLRIALQTCSALVAAHAVGIIHRDIKPDNVFLCASDVSEETVKLLDFGVAKVVEQTDLTLAGSIVGTLAYMPPEQARGDVLDGRADLYALGACMYLALAGVKPFADRTPQGLLVALFRAMPDPIEVLVPHLDPAIAEIVRKAMAKERSDRFATAIEMRDAIANALRQDRPSFEPAPTTLRMPRTTPTLAPPPPVISSMPPPLTSVIFAGDRTTQPSKRRKRTGTMQRAAALGAVALLALASGVAFDVLVRKLDAPRVTAGIEAEPPPTAISSVALTSAVLSEAKAADASPDHD